MNEFGIRIIRGFFVVTIGSIFITYKWVGRVKWDLRLWLRGKILKRKR